MDPLVVATAAVVAVGIVAAASRAVMRAMIPGPNFHRYPDFPGTTPVILAVTNRLPRRKQDIVIVRRAVIKPHDVILIRPRALNAELLAHAIVTLQTTRRELGRIPETDAVVEVERAAELPPRVDEAERWIASLRSAKPMKVPRVGFVPFIGLHVNDAEQVPQVSS